MFVQNAQDAFCAIPWNANAISPIQLPDVRMYVRTYIRADILNAPSDIHSEAVLSRCGRAGTVENSDRQTCRLLIGGYDDAVVFRVRENPPRAHAREDEVSIWPPYDNMTAGNFRIPIHGRSNGKNGNPSVISVMDSFDSTLVCMSVPMHTCVVSFLYIRVYVHVPYCTHSVRDPDRFMC